MATTSNNLGGGRWPLDQDGRVLFGNTPPEISKREKIKRKICFDQLGEILDESERMYLSNAFANKPKRFAALKEEKIFISDDERTEDKKNEIITTNNLNRIIQKKRSLGSYTIDHALCDLKDLYSKSSYWWPVKQEIIFVTAKILIGK